MVATLTVCCQGLFCVLATEVLSAALAEVLERLGDERLVCDFMSTPQVPIFDFASQYVI